MNSEKFNQNTANNDSEPPRRRTRALDIVAYLLCLLISFGIWAYVTSIEAEDYEYKFTDVVVDLEGVAKLMSESNLSPISGDGNKITVTVKGPRREIAKYSSDDIYAYVDLSTITTASRHSLEVHVNLPGNIQLVSADPAKVTVFVDETIDKQIPVKIDMIYSAENNITVLSPKIDDEDIIHDMITVTGPKSVVDHIDYALITKDLGKVSTGVKFNSTFILVDKAGNTVKNPYVKTDVNEISVSVSVTVEKLVHLNAIFNKDPGDENDYIVNWMYDGTLIEAVKIVGDPQIVGAYEDISITIGNVTLNGSVELPRDVAVYVGENKISTISYTVTKMPPQNNG